MVINHILLLPMLVGGSNRGYDPYLWLHLSTLAWIVFLIYWIVSARKLKSVKQREPRGERLVQVIVMVGAYSLMFNEFFGRGWLGTRFLPEWSPIGATGLAVTVLGVAIAIWARWHLGENWSIAVTLKEGHELIRSGPYRRIRHPIYTGMLLATGGTAVALGEFRGLIACAIAATNLYLKAKKEERFLAVEFGEAFDEHTLHTGMFLPKLT
ncbi:MAG TPA: isoprenylcysteine carboxylmethyltransferase family protein [Candidatus Limnocylindrales bacterium]|nr:isoprenylcysteine carboxylmethyltransferase family protein [Candidatus Limnocylindrales bacterium]